MINSVVTLFFLPTFFFLVYYFEFKSVVLAYLFLSFFLIVFTYIERKKFKDAIVPIVYLLLLTIAYFYASFEIVKFIPVLMSAAVLIFFIDSSINKKELILKFTQKFYRKKLSEGEVLFLKNGDIFWVYVMFINTMIMSALVYFGSDRLWLFYSSIGWYLYFLLSLIIQIIYGRFYAIRMYSK